jgi:hypothetical protein
MLYFSISGMDDLVHPYGCLGRLAARRLPLKPGRRLDRPLNSGHDDRVPAPASVLGPE